MVPDVSKKKLLVMAENLEKQRADSALPVSAIYEVLDTSNAQEAELVSQAKTTGFESAKDGVGEPPILPRQAWNSEITFLKVLLKAKQALDQREKYYSAIF